jgi:hypothetical protein
MQSKSLKSMLAALLAAGSVQAAAPQYQQAMSAAQRDLTKLTAHAAKGRSGSPAGELPFGLGTSEPGQARIAYGFPVYTVNPEALQSGAAPLRRWTSWRRRTANGALSSACGASRSAWQRWNW